MNLTLRGRNMSLMDPVSSCQPRGKDCHKSSGNDSSLEASLSYTNPARMFLHDSTAFVPLFMHMSPPPLTCGSLPLPSVKPLKSSSCVCPQGHFCLRSPSSCFRERRLFQKIRSSFVFKQLLSSRPKKTLEMRESLSP